MSSIGRNDRCPCGSGLKFKNCCLGKKPWESILRGSLDSQLRQLSIRGKNIFFINQILAALQIDNASKHIDFAKLKQAFTPLVVQRINESLLHIWQDFEDYQNCLQASSKNISGLYIGTYEPDAVLQAVTRHSLYSERMYLVDPFMYPGVIRDEFNPLLHPEEHRINTIKSTYLWLSLAPWIHAGIVAFIRPPTDFIPNLLQEVCQLNKKQFDSNAELNALLKEEVEARVSKHGPRDRGFGEHFFLSFPDEWYVEQYSRFPAGEMFPTAEVFLDYIKYRREIHPYHVDRLPGQTSELIYVTAGANYELAKRICQFTGSHLITDFKTYWKQIELDRKISNIDVVGWSSFAKALQNADLKVLSNVSIEAALTLRKENRLENMRNFFHRVWRSCRDEQEFAEVNAANLAAELDDHVREAKVEWAKIDQDLLKWFGGQGAAMIAAGLVGFVPAATGAIATGAAGLIQAQHKRYNFKETYPAGFFLTIKSK